MFSSSLNIFNDFWQLYVLCDKEVQYNEIAKMVEWLQITMFRAEEVFPANFLNYALIKTMRTTISFRDTRKKVKSQWRSRFIV